MKSISALLLAATLAIPGVPVLAAETSTDETEEVAPHLFGELTTGWITSADGMSRAKFKITHELATNRIQYVNGIAAFSTSYSGVLEGYWISSHTAPAVGQVKVVVGYRVNGQEKMGTFWITI